MRIGNHGWIQIPDKAKVNIVLKCVEVHYTILSVAFSCQLGPATCLRLCLQDDVLTDFRDILLSTVPSQPWNCNYRDEVQPHPVSEVEVCDLY